jgi:hypothetical protein
MEKTILIELDNLYKKEIKEQKLFGLNRFYFKDVFHKLKQ